MTKHCKTCQAPFETNFAQKRLCDDCKKKNRKDYSIRHPEQRMLTGARYRAKVDGIPFNLNKSDIVIPEFCPVLGIKLECGVGSGWVTDNSPSLDKIIPELGYVKGNVVVISARANRMKSNGSLAELKKLVSWLEENQTVSSTTMADPVPSRITTPKKRFLRHSEETRRRMGQAQAEAWASGRRGDSRLDKMVESTVAAVSSGLQTFVACKKENVVGLTTRLKLKGLQTFEIDGGILVAPPLTTAPTSGTL